MDFDFSDWPVVPADMRPKALYHMSNLGQEMNAALKEGGWSPVDVRLLPERTDDEKIQAIKCWLTGVRLGSIQPHRGGIHFTELEARIYGLLANKRPDKPTEPMAAEDLQGILGPLAAKKGK